MPKSMTATKARQNFFQLIETAERPGMAVAITHEGHPKVIVMSFEEFEGWQETLEILSDAALMKDIRMGLKDEVSVSLEHLEGAGHAMRHVHSRSQAKGRKAVQRPSRKRSGHGSRRAARAS